MSDLVGSTLVVLAFVIPSSTWIDTLRTPPTDLRNQLLLGATLFRIGLAVLGLFVSVGGRKGWWQSTPSQPVTAPRPVWDRERLVLIGILTAATALRLYRLNQGLWADEIHTLVYQARAPFGEIVTTYESQNQHFLFSLFAHASLLFFGESAWALRLPAVLFGVGSIWALYLLAREVTDPAEALLSGTLLTFSYHHVWFSQNARGYTGLLFWTLLASWLFVRGLAEQQPRLWLYYAGAVALGVYTNMTMLFVATGQFVTYVWTLLTTRRECCPTTGAPLFSGFCLSALLTFQFHALTLPQILGPALADLSLVETWKNPLWTLQEITRGFHLGFGKGVGALVAIGVIGAGSLSYLRRQPLVLQLLVIPVILGASVTLAIGHPLWPRLFFFALGFGILVVVRGTRVLGEAIGRLLDWSDNRSAWLGLALTTAVIVLSASSLVFVYRPKQDFVGARDFVNQARQPGDAVVAVGVAGPAYESYYAPEWETVETLEQLNAIRGRSDRTWLLYTLPLHMESYHPEIFAVVQREFHLVRAFPGSLSGGTIFVYKSDDLVGSP